MSDSSRETYEQVEVWRFRRFDVRSRQYVTSIGKAEVETIERFGAQVIPGSMETVPQHKLDGNRIYTPPTATLSPVARRRLASAAVEPRAVLADALAANARFQDGQGSGAGTLAPAAKIVVKDGAFVVEDFASELVKLTAVSKAK